VSLRFPGFLSSADFTLDSATKIKIIIGSQKTKFWWSFGLFYRPKWKFTIYALGLK
jgi:hypothetical protein